MKIRIRSTQDETDLAQDVFLLIGFISAKLIRMLLSFRPVKLISTAWVFVDEDHNECFETNDIWAFRIVTRKEEEKGAV